jgi:hypothetical protein
MRDVCHARHGLVVEMEELGILVHLDDLEDRHRVCK